MKKTIMLAYLITLIISCEKRIYVPIDDITFEIPENTHTQGDLFREKLEEYRKCGIVGISLIVDDPEKGFWGGAVGKARIEDNIDMTKFHLHYSASVAKLYTGAAIMLLVEDGLIDLDAKISKYLPSKIYDKITYGKEITVTQLMSHTSGIHDWMNSPQERFDYINNPNKPLTQKSILDHMYNKPAEFAPGKDFAYSNSNMVLLAIIIDYVTQNDHSVFFQNRIFSPLNLQHTYYHVPNEQPMPKGATNCYSNFYNDDRVVNITDYYGKRWGKMIGDDGVIASVYDYMKFAKSLFEGDLLKHETLEIMKKRPDIAKGYNFWQYGLSVEYWKNPNGRLVAMGHSGNSEGTGARLFYFPEKKTTIALFMNMGAVRKEGDMFFHKLWPEIVNLAFH